MSYHGLTSTARRNSRCAHRCISFGRYSWCTVTARASVGGNRHAGWGWCYRCGRRTLADPMPIQKWPSDQRNWEGRGRWYNARVTGVSRSGRSCTYNVHYDDGDSERNVAVSRIRARRCSARNYSVCDRVSVNYRGRGRYYAGRVTARSGRGCGASYSINYDDGDTETGVSAARIRALRRSQSGSFRRNQAVMGNWRGRGRWYAGVVTRVRSACCYTVRYSDGDSENCVDPRNLRRARGGQCRVRSRSCTTGGSVSANWRGYGRYYAGRVTACIGGMYSITYSDGDRESNVPASRIRSCSMCPSTRYRVGQMVYGNYRGEGYWYPGRVTASASTGYTIRLSDGDIMRATTTCHMRPRAWRQGSFTIGQRARVRYRGGRRCYAATVCGAGSRRGTYKICYNDGDKENNVASRNIFAGSRQGRC